MFQHRNQIDWQNLIGSDIDLETQISSDIGPLYAYYCCVVNYFVKLLFYYNPNSTKMVALYYKLD